MKTRGWKQVGRKMGIPYVWTMLAYHEQYWTMPAYFSFSFSLLANFVGLYYRFLIDFPGLVLIIYCIFVLCICICFFIFCVSFFGCPVQENLFCSPVGSGIQRKEFPFTRIYKRKFPFWRWLNPVRRTNLITRNPSGLKLYCELGNIY